MINITGLFITVLVIIFGLGIYFIVTKLKSKKIKKPSKLKFKIRPKVRFERLLAIFSAVSTIIFFFLTFYHGPPKGIYFYIWFMLSLLFMVYFFFLSPVIKDKAKKIEVGVLLASAIFFFGAFYISWGATSVSILNEFSSLYYDYSCILFNSENETLDISVFNTDLTKGVPINLKFNGKGVCMREEGLCKNKGWISSRPVMIFPGGNYTFSIRLNKISDDYCKYTIFSYTPFNWRIAGISCRC